GTDRFIRFLDDNGDLIDRYQYKLSGDSLKLKDSDPSNTLAAWFTMTFDDTQLGQLGDSCGGFVRNPVQCAPGLVCQYGGVPDVPGTCVQDSPSGNACTDNGGSCVALAPGTCPNGTTGGYSCGGGLGVTCCMPHAANCRAIVECVQGKHWDETK